MKLVENITHALMSTFGALPALDAQSDLTGQGLTMDWWAGSLGENVEVPRVGDVVIRVTSCSMGMSVRRDTRYRVTGAGPNPRSVIAAASDETTAKSEVLYVFYMRRHKTLRRTWVLID